MVEAVGIQVIGVVLAGIILYQAFALFRRRKFKQKDLGIWGVVSIIIFIVSVFPNIINSFLGLLNLKRSLDALLIIGVFGAYALVFYIYIRMQQTQREITDLVRKVALKFEEKGRKKK